MAAAVVALGEKVLSAKSIICDIEGTTTSISFVQDTLFPYALKNVEEYLKNNWNEDATKTVVAALREQAEEDKKAEVEGVTSISAGDSEDIIPEIVKNVEWQMSKDRKTGSLKTLQGLVWAKGYKDGTIKGHVYDDVQKAFEQWTESGRKIYIYSSGSVDAQKLLFEHSEHGNLLKYLAGHYDTKIGAKREKDSYESILKNIESSAEETLFLTDVYAEAKAAKDAGLNVVLLDRPGNEKLSDEERKEFTVISTFSDLSFEVVKKENGDTTVPNGGKRKIEDTIEEATKEEDQAQEPPSKVTKVEGEKTKESAENGTTDDKGTVDSSPAAAESVESKSTEVMEVDGGEAAKSTDAKEEKVAEKMEEDSTVEKTEGADKMDLDKNVEPVDETVKLVTENSEKTEAIVKEAEIEKDDKVVEKEEPTVKENTASVKTADESDGAKKEVKPTAETQKDTEVVRQDEVTKTVVDKVEATADSATPEPVVEEKKDEDKVKETVETEKTESKTVEGTTEVSSKSDIPVEKKVADEVKEVEEKIDDVKTDKVDCEKPNSSDVTTEKEQTPESTTNQGETEEAKPAEVNGAVTEAKPTANGGSSAGDEEKNGSDSDKENDTSLNNCEADEANGEKTNGTTTPTTTAAVAAATTESSTNAEEVTSTEIKAKKVIEPVTAAVTPAPPIEAES